MFRAALFLLAALAQSALAYRSVCYYTNWAQYRNGKGKFVPEDVDPNLCTHVIYSFAKIVNNDVVAFEWNDESTAWSTGMYQRMLDMKKVNPNLKVMLGVGGWGMGSGPFSAIAATDATRKLFAQNLVTFIRDHGFDGFDNDWEYPGSRGSPADDKMKNVLLMQEIRKAFDEDAARTGRPHLELSEAIGVGKATMDNGYDVPALSQVVDFFNLMTYDIHGSFDGETGHNAPLYPDPAVETGDELHFNVDWAVQTLAAKGMPRDKMNLGIPTYGRSFTLDDPNNNGVNVPSTRPGDAGRYTGEKGFISYYEICEALQSGATVHTIANQHAKYLVQGTQWIGFDDVQSVQEKACYAKQQGIGGVMYWALDLDDFKGTTCNQGSYPLINAANAEFKNPNSNICQSTGNAPAVTPGFQTQAPYVPPATYPPRTQAPYYPTGTPRPYVRPVTQAPYVTQSPYVPQRPATYIPLTHGPPGPYQTQAPITMAPFSFTLATGAPYIPVTQAPLRTQRPYVPATQAPLRTQRPFVPTAPPATAAPAGQYAFTLPYFPGTQAPTGTGYHPAGTLAPGGYIPAGTPAPGGYPQAGTPAPTSRPATSAPYNPFTYPVVVQTTQRPYVPATAVQQATGYNCQGKINDFYTDPASCSSFYICASQQAFKVDCARGLLFNPSAKHCDWASNVNCGFNTQPPALATSRPYVPVVTSRPYVPVVTNRPYVPVVTSRPYVPVVTSRPYVPVVTSRPYVPVVTSRPYAPVVTSRPYVPVITSRPYVPVITSRPYIPVTQAPSTQAFKCAAGQSGIFSHPSDCRKYIQCSSGVQFTMTCPNNLMFNPNMGSCDFAVNVPQCLSG